MKPITIKKKIIQDTLYYDNTELLDYRIEYPEFQDDSSSIQQINEYYKTAAMKLQKYCTDYLYKLAVDQYHISKEKQIPIRAGQFYLVYEVPYNKDCIASLFFDQYEYMGGAHGSTTRMSQTWNLSSGKRISLHHVIPSRFYHDEAIVLINKQIDTQIRRGNDIYYDDCERDVAAMFEPKNFYLKPKGVVIYFQQYDIAPYVSGIPEFLLPYSEQIILPPCRK